MTQQTGKPIIVEAPYLLYSPLTHEVYSATKEDYFNTPNDHIFKDSEGNEMDLVATYYNELGNLAIKTVVKDAPVTPGDLKY